MKVNYQSPGRHYYPKEGKMATTTGITGDKALAECWDALDDALDRIQVAEERCQDDLTCSLIRSMYGKIVAQRIEDLEPLLVPDILDDEYDFGEPGDRGS